MHVWLHDANAALLQLRISYTAGDTTFTLQFDQKLTHRSISEPHKVTHMHPGGIVSYAILRPPGKNESCASDTSSTLPVLMMLHGAGLEADCDIVAHALDPLPDLCAWVLFPTGVTPWSGDDWR